MAKKYSAKFWIIFWLISVIFLIGFFATLQIKRGGISGLADKLPLGEKNKAIVYLVDYFLKNDQKEKILMVLFQNNMELRPGGGFIGSFGILKVKNGRVADLQVYDLSNFDANLPDTMSPPYPIEEILHTKYWKLRDSNFSPDFVENAKRAEEFYRLGGGRENLDGVLGITTNVLTSFLKATGPVKIAGYPGTYADENAVITLEYQVEKAYAEQGINKEARKSIMDDLAEEIISKVSEFSIAQKLKLAKIIIADLDKKDVQLYFENTPVQKQMEKAAWAGRVDENWKGDYLMIVDANLASYKSDYHIKRSVEYAIDFSGGVPEAVLKITYNHTAEQKDWMTKNYLTYLRVYVPDGSRFMSGKNFDDPHFGKEFNKLYFGSLVSVPLGTSKVVEIRYFLPAEFKSKSYALKVQKQPGTKDVFYVVNMRNKEFDTKGTSFVLNEDIVLDDLIK
jgi:hypothetical protein